MNEKDRIEDFRKFVEKDPENTFARYALAMEYRKTGRLAEAMREFDGILLKDPDYVPAYQMGAQTALDLDDDERAREIVSRGTEVARRQGNTHAASEMEEMLQ